MCEKLNGATDAARRLAYRKFPRGPRDLSFLGDKIESLVWAYADGLYYEFHWKHAQGRTSLAEMLAYDMEKWERTTEIHRALFESLLIGVEKREAQVGKEGDRREEKSADQARGEESATGGETHP